MFSRRRLLAAAALPGLGALLRPGFARAAAPGARKFVFVVNYGGWDPLCVYAPKFDAGAIEMEVDAAPMQIGGLPLVDHPDRPSVRAFFERWHTRAVVLNGLLVPSVAHPPSQRALLTGSTNTTSHGDWPALLAHARGADFTLPGVVLSGPSFPGDLAGVVSRAGSSGQLDQLLSGELLSDTPVAAFPSGAEAAVDDWLASRAAGREDWAAALSRARALKERRGDVVWGSTADFASQIARSVEILAADLARVVTMGFEIWPWDTHAANDPYQSINFEGLFDGLGTLLDLLASTPASSGAMLDEETVVVVCSEMGRTPLHNGSEGRDHWPYTSALVVGPGLDGDRVVGAVDDVYNGALVDPTSGEVSTSGVVVDPSVFGATLLALGDVDPGEVLPGVPVIEGMLR